MPGGKTHKGGLARSLWHRHFGLDVLAQRPRSNGRHRRRRKIPVPGPWQAHAKDQVEGWPPLVVLGACQGAAMAAPTPSRTRKADPERTRQEGRDLLGAQVPRVRESPSQAPGGGRSLQESHWQQESHWPQGPHWLQGSHCLQEPHWLEPRPRVPCRDRNGEPGGTHPRPRCGRPMVSRKGTKGPWRGQCSSFKRIAYDSSRD
jgi:hypothetical protein